VSGTSLLDGRELDVAEALGAAVVGVGGQADTQDGTLLAEDITESVLGGTEGQVANEESVALGAGGVTEALGTALGTVTLLLVVLATSGVVQVDGTAIELGTLLGLEGLGSIGSAGVLDVTEAIGEARIRIWL
jgi:3D (Asp-Asp-Asp) domain-containing protein